MNMRNATCAGTETSKVPTRVTLLFISYSVIQSKKEMAFLKALCVVLLLYSASLDASRRLKNDSNSKKRMLGGGGPPAAINQLALQIAQQLEQDVRQAARRQNGALGKCLPFIEKQDF